MGTITKKIDFKDKKEALGEKGLKHKDPFNRSCALEFLDDKEQYKLFLKDKNEDCRLLCLEKLNDEDEWNKALADDHPVCYLAAKKYFNEKECNNEIEKLISKINNNSQKVDFKAVSKLYSNRGCYYFKLKNYDFALSDFKKALELDDKNHLAHYNISNLYRYYGMRDLTLNHLECAVRLHPNKRYYYRLLATSTLYLFDT